MHLRKLVLGCGIAFALLSNLASALGLGEARLNSTLNEPLNAEIKLLDTRGLSAGQILVSLASPADFERNGVERLYFLTEFEFEVLLGHPGGAIVRITSHNPVREPFINLLVEARWPTGRLLREYTLLMDLPTFSETRAAAPVLSAARTAPSTAANTPSQSSQSTPSASSSRTEATRSSRSGQVSSGVQGDTYSVHAKDTLWEIALNIRPDSSHSVHQTMLAIQRLNPDAFINGNINLLRKGQVLRIPSSDEIKSVTQREAVNEVARQNQSWSDDSMGAQLSASQRDRSSRRSSDTLSGSVSLATPNKDDSYSGQGSGDDRGRGKALESELSSTLEELDKAKSENSELNSRVRDLEAQIQTMERLVDVSSEQLRALQLNAAQNDSLAQDTSTAQVEAGLYDENNSQKESGLHSDSVDDNSQTTESSLLDEDTESTSDTEVVSQAETEQPVVEAPKVEEPSKPIDSRRVVMPPPSKTLVDHVMDNIVWLAGGLVVLLGLVAFVLHRRKQAAEEQDFSDDDPFNMDVESFDEEQELDASDLPEEFDSDQIDLPEDEDISAEAETGDVVGEADIYIAYGKLDQAEDMLLRGLDKDPSSVDIKLKLLEVYSQTQDVNKFDQYYAGLIGVAGQSALSRAAELRGHIADAGEFSPAEFVANTNDNDDGFGSIDLALSDDALELDAETDSLLDDSGELVFDADDLAGDLDFDFEDSENNLTPLLDESELAPKAASDTRASTRYDMSFEQDDKASNLTSEENELSFDFELDDAESSPAIEATTASLGELELNEDDDLSFELDDLSDDLTVDAQELVAPSFEVDEDELSFDLDDSEFATSELEELSAQVATTEASSELSDSPAEVELQLTDDVADDFNLDMDMGDLDLAALDEEMDSLDADFAEAEESLDNLDSTHAVTGLGELDFADVDTEVDTTEQSIVNELEVDTEDDVFTEALSEFTPENTSQNLTSEEDFSSLSDDDMDSELDFLADADEAATKLDLARAYIDMGDTDGARDILAEVAHEGNDEQRQEAVDLLSRIDV